MQDMMMGNHPTLLLVDDDELYCQVLASSLHKRNFNVLVAHTVQQALTMVGEVPPKFAIVDLNMPGESGLVLIEKIHQLDASAQMVVLTGYASIATAVEAIKLGATHYLSKPADADEIIAAFGYQTGNASYIVAPKPMSTKRLEWEHIQKVLHECEGNVSETARRLNMHRRTLQRKINSKRPPNT